MEEDRRFSVSFPTGLSLYTVLGMTIRGPRQGGSIRPLIKDFTSILVSQWEETLRLADTSSK
jgi:hypothetical protein